MGLHTTTDAGSLLDVLEHAVRADPVRNTMLATIRGALRAEGAGGWGAVEGTPADPVAVAARTSPRHPVALTDGWRDLVPLADALAALAELTSLGGPVATVERLTELLDRPVTDTRGERLFRCDTLVPPAGVRGAARRATAADAGLITAWRGPYLVDVFGRVPPGQDLACWADVALSGLGTWLWLDDSGAPVAQAVARAAVAGVARIGPVYTPPEHRGRGYGSAVTAAATAAVQAAGSVPVLYTDLANPTSNRIYQAIGYRAVADRSAVWFG